MKETEISRPALGRIPMYLRFLKGLPPSMQNISSTVIAKELGLGEVQVRKDLGALCGSGKPKVGYQRSELIESLQAFMTGERVNAVIVGAGRLGKALLDYTGFEDFGISVLAAFDERVSEDGMSEGGKPILPMTEFSEFCSKNNVGIGIIAVPSESAQSVCNLFYENGIRLMWCFAPCQLYKPADAVIQYENLALSLAHLKMQIK
ncbi:MAG: redox-sensing transcriptional repressor Rex [Acutalibacteraceae bacterium]